MHGIKAVGALPEPAYSACTSQFAQTQWNVLDSRFPSLTYVRPQASAVTNRLNNNQPKKESETS